MRTPFAIIAVVFFIFSIVYTYWDDLVSLFKDPPSIVLSLEPEPEPEPFKLVFASLMQEPSRYKIDGWIGETPYLLDLKNSTGNGKYARNRIEVGIPYVEVEKFIPNRPSLRKSTEGESPILLVELFKVENVKNEIKGGTKKVGTAKIFDYPLRKEAYEITSLTDFSLTPDYILKFDLTNSYQTESVKISSREINKPFTIGYMKYHISNLDYDKRSLSIRRTNSENGLIVERKLTVPKTVLPLKGEEPKSRKFNPRIINYSSQPNTKNPKSSIPAIPKKDYVTYFGKGTSQQEAYNEARKQIKGRQSQHSYRFRKTGATWTCTLYAVTGK